MPKLKKKSADQKRRESRARMARRMGDPVTRELIRNANTIAHQRAREDPLRRESLQVPNTIAHQRAREDPLRREAEQQVNTTAHQRAREDPLRRESLQVANTIAHQRAREDPVKRTPEKNKDAQARQIARQDPVKRTPEKIKDAQARQIARQDPVKRTPEKIKDAEAKRAVRNLPVRRLAEQFTDTENHRKRRKMNQSQYEYNMEKYTEKIRRAPSLICSCCGGLFYEESTTLTSETKLQTLGCTDEFIKSILCVPQLEHRFCSTCKISVAKKRVPKLCLYNGFDFPTIPDELKDLSPLEERLVALRLPFMQIRLLGSERQSLLRGNVVNVENDLDVCAQVLPRKFNETSTVQVQLMRRLKYNKPYMYEKIRPQKVYRAAKYLINSELYKSENVILSEDWSLYVDEDAIDFICLGNEEEVTESHTTENVPEDNDYLPPNETAENQPAIGNNDNLGADETLIFRENIFTGIRIAPGEGKLPIPLHCDLNAELLSFPCIYGGVERKFKPNLKVSYTDIAKSEMRRYDRRACNPSKILYSFKRSFNEKVYQAVQVCMRKKVGTKNVTAANIKTPGFIENLLKKDEGYAVFKSLRSSPSYWKEKTKKVLGMVRQVGKCTFFITFSAAETKWAELLVMLMKIVRNRDITEEEALNLTFEDKADLIRSDPVTCMRHFDHRFRALLTLLLKPEGGIFSPYKLEDYFSRLEFQMRGSPHAHGLYWIADAPVYIEGDKDSENECTKFIDQFITCERCEEGQMANLIGYQIHKHSRTCEKKLKFGVKCRFGFPKPPMENTIILQPLPKDVDTKTRRQATDLYLKIQDALNDLGRSFKEEIGYDLFLESLNTNHFDYILAVRSSIKRTTVFLKRSTNSIFVNPYNRQLLEAWGANIDIQFVLDTYACARYCVGYILKSEQSVCVNGLTNHYSQRPKELESICLAEFASMYEFTKNKSESNVGNEAVPKDVQDTVLCHPPKPKPTNKWQLQDASGHIRKRTVRKVIRFRHYSKMQDPFNYYREQLMLFVPWRDETVELLNDPINKAAKFEAAISEACKPFYYKYEVDDEALIDIMNEAEDDYLNQEDHNNLENDELQIEMEEYNEHNFSFDKATSSCRVENFLPPRLIDETEYIKIMRTLNDKQNRFVLNVLHLVKTSKNPFYIFLSGGAGVGKSHAITAIVQSYIRYDIKQYDPKSPLINPEQICVIVSAPTGKAAFNVFGMTLHCTFKLPPTQYGGKICNLDDGAVNTMRLKLAKTRLFIIDEVSMVSVKQLYDIDQSSPCHWQRAK